MERSFRCSDCDSWKWSRSWEVSFRKVMWFMTFGLLVLTSEQLSRDHHTTCPPELLPAALKPAADCDMDPPAEENMLSDSRPLLLSPLIYSCALRAAVWGGGPVDERPGSWNIQPDSKHSPDGPEEEEEEEENTGMKRENGSCFSRKCKRKQSEQIPFTIKPTCKQKKTDWRRSPTEQQALITCLYVRFTPDDLTEHRAAWEHLDVFDSFRDAASWELLKTHIHNPHSQTSTREHKHVHNCWTETGDGESLNASEGNQKSLCSVFTQQ